MAHEATKGAAFRCPACGSGLQDRQGFLGVYWHCPACGGRTASVGQLRRLAPAPVVNGLWQAARRPDAPRRRDCPACGRGMAEVVSPGAEHTLDVCPLCQFIWFDPAEFEAVPALPASVPPPPLPPEAAQAVARLKVEAIRQRAARERDEAEPLPEEWWKWLPAVLGLPVEMDQQALRRPPWLTWLTALLMALGTVAVLKGGEATVHLFGLIPESFGRFGGLTLVTSFFLHGGILHFLSNLYFLLVFGDNVEDRLGAGRWLLLVVAAALAGDAAHILADPHSDVPLVGASGGISGLLVFYTLSFPRAKLGLFLRFFPFFRWITFPAYALILVWLLLQILGVWQQLAGYTRVSSLAHLGGAAVGVLFWLLERPAREETGGGDYLR